MNPLQMMAHMELTDSDAGTHTHTRPHTELTDSNAVTHTHTRPHTWNLLG